MSTSTAPKSPTTIAFASAVKARMRETGIIQRDIVERTGIAKDQVSRILAAKAGNVTTFTMDRIAEAFGTDAVELIYSWKKNQHSS